MAPAGYICRSPSVAVLHFYYSCAFAYYTWPLPPPSAPGCCPPLLLLLPFACDSGSGTCGMRLVCCRTHEWIVRKRGTEEATLICVYVVSLRVLGAPARSVSSWRRTGGGWRGCMGVGGMCVPLPKAEEREDPDSEGW